MGSKYLYQKIMSAETEVIKLLPSTEDLEFLDRMKINYTPSHCDNYVTISKAHFMKKVAV